MKAFDKWFETFKAEKDIPFKSWEIEGPDGTVHFIDNEVVMEAILGTSDAEKAQIKDTIVKIDVANGDVNHFFHHLAKGLVANFGG